MQYIIHLHIRHTIQNKTLTDQKKKIGKLHSNFNYHKLHIHNRKNRVVMGDFYISFFQHTSHRLHILFITKSIRENHITSRVNFFAIKVKIIAQ